MGQKGKFLVMEDGQLDLSQYVWDDHRFADILMREKSTAWPSPPRCASTRVSSSVTA